MEPDARISAAILAAGQRGQTALVPFITAGYPEKDRFTETLLAVAEVGDVVEVGVPFSDPMADGLTIQRSSYGAIQAGVTLKWIIESIRSVRDQLQAPVVLMSYLNPLLAYGLTRLASDARNAGVCGFIVPDLPYEECADFRESVKARHLALIQLVTPATPAARLKHLVGVSDGFVYAVTVRGITGGSELLPDETSAYLAAVKEVAGDQPVCAGFGIRKREQVDAFAPHVDGVVVGSALIEALEAGEDPQRWLRDLLG